MEETTPSNINILPALRWTARIFGSLLFLLVVLFAMGEGFPNPVNLPAREIVLTIAFVVMLIGILLSWKLEGWGGSVILAGFVLFEVVNYLTSGRFTGGWVFLLFPFIGCLFLAYWWLQKKERLNVNDADATR